MNNKKEQEREELHKTIWKIANETERSDFYEALYL